MLVGLALAASVFGGTGEIDAKKRRRRKRSNMPANWSWPPNRQMKKAAAECRDQLTAAGVKWSRGPRTRAVAAPVVVESMQFGSIKLTPTFRKPPFVLDCHLALALARISKALANSGVAELRFSTIHQYRRVRLNGKTRRSLSRHSLGLAIDVYELVTTDGETVVIESDYPGSDHARAVEAALERSEIFRTILTPGNDPRSHYDHFHIEARIKIAAPRQKRKKKRRKKKRRRRRR